MRMFDITNPRIISVLPYDFSYVDDIDYIQISPVSEYYFKLNDVSINLYISLKWALLGYIFLKSISTTLIEINKSSLKFENILERDIYVETKYEDHELFLDDLKVLDDKDLENFLNNDYNEEIFNENTKIRLKLKINLNDFLLLQNVYFPTMFLKIP